MSAVSVTYSPLVFTLPALGCCCDVGGDRDCVSHLDLDDSEPGKWGEGNREQGAAGGGGGPAVFGIDQAGLESGR